MSPNAPVTATLELSCPAPPPANSYPHGLVIAELKNDGANTYEARVQRLDDIATLETRSLQPLSSLTAYLALLHATYGSENVVLLSRITPPNVRLAEVAAAGGGTGGASPADPNPKGFTSLTNPTTLTAGGPAQAFATFETNQTSNKLTAVHFHVRVQHLPGGSGFKLVVPAGVQAFAGDPGSSPPPLQLNAGDEVDVMYLQRTSGSSRVINANSTEAFALSCLAGFGATGSANIIFAVHSTQYGPVEATSQVTV